MFYDYEFIKKSGYSSPWQFIDQFKNTFPDLYEGSEVNHEGVEIKMRNNFITKIEEEKKEKTIKAKIFEDICCERELADFLNEKKITRNEIISISMSSDSEAHRRLGKYGVNRILLVWEDSNAD